MYIPERKRFRVVGMENPQRRKKNQLKKKNNIWLRAREILQMRNKLKFKKWKKTKITKIHHKKEKSEEDENIVKGKGKNGNDENEPIEEKEEKEETVENISTQPDENEIKDRPREIEAKNSELTDGKEKNHY